MPSPSEARALRSAEESLSGLPSGVSADVRVTLSSFGTMRFANGRIHQPHVEESAHVSCRVCEDMRLATATTDDLSKEGIFRVIREARTLAKVAPQEKHFLGFASDGGRRLSPVAYSERTASMGVDAQAKLAEQTLQVARESSPGSRISGVLNIGAESIAVANTSGLRRSTRRSVAQSSVLVERLDLDPPSSGWSETADWDAARIDFAGLGREAADRAASRAPESAEAGKYRVLFGGAAASELLSMLGYLGFGGLGEEEGWSCLKRSRGKRVASEEVSLIDDGRSRETLPQGIDYEGASKRRTPLLDQGVAGGAVTDLVTAGRLGLKRTGHALPPESPRGEWGPVPQHQILRTGTASQHELVKETRRGLLVTRFHYVRVVHPGKSIITGMTRDGTYLIEHGEVTTPVRNLRFTDSVLACLAKVELVGKESRRYADERGFFTVTCPSLLTGSFRFTSATLF